MPLDDAQIGRIIVEFLADGSGGLLAACGSRAEALRCLRITQWRRRPKLAGDARAYAEPEGIKIIDAGHPISTVVRTIPWDDVLDEAGRLCGRTFDGPSKVEGDGLGATKEADASHPQGAPSQVSSLSLVDKFAAIERFWALERWKRELALCAYYLDAIQMLIKIRGPVTFDDATYAGLPRLHGTAPGLRVGGDVGDPIIPWEEVLDAQWELIESGGEGEGEGLGAREDETSEGRGADGRREATPASMLRAGRAAPLTKKQRAALHKAAVAGGASTTLPDGIAALDPEARAPDAWRGASEETASPDTRPLSLRAIAVESIGPNPWQPRRDFDEAILDSLGDSLVAQGQLQPVIVRPAPKACELHGVHYQLVDGERRLRAARLKKLEYLTAVVREVSDAEMAEMAIVANDQREDLNPIERATAYARVLQETGVTQEALGKKLGRSQAYVANAVRLLELPEEWRRKVISREMSSSHAKEFLRVAKYPKIVKELAEWVKREDYDGKERGKLGALVEFREAIAGVVRLHCRRLGGDVYDRGRRVPVFTPTPEQAAKLDLIEIEDWDDSKATFAYNTKLFDSLQAQFVKTLPEPKAPKASQHDVCAGGAKQLTADGLEWRVRGWRVNWWRTLLVERLKTARGDDLTLRLLLFMAVESPLVERVLFAKAVGCKKPTNASAWVAEAILAAKKPVALAKDAMLRSLDPAQRGRLYIDDEDEIAAALLLAGVDPAAEWKRRLAGKMTRGYFALRTKEQLLELAGELNVFVDGAKSKETIITQLVAAPETKSRLPKELGGRDEGRGTRKKKK
jgi:ParB family chromosome partitioning protein